MNAPKSRQRKHTFSATRLPVTRHSGFTLLELVVVITIVGILLAFALPRFFSLQNDARKAKAKAVYGSVRTAAALAKSRCEVDIGTSATGPHACTATGGFALMDGLPITIVNKFPTADANGILAAAAINPVADDLLVSSPGGPDAGATITFDIATSPDPANCRISYTAPRVGATAVVSLLTTGC